MGNAEKFKPTQPGANNSFVEPALSAGHSEPAWLFHSARLKSACLAVRAGVSQGFVFTGRKGQRGARGQGCRFAHGVASCSTGASLCHRCCKAGLGRICPVCSLTSGELLSLRPAPG